MIEAAERLHLCLYLNRLMAYFRGVGTQEPVNDTQYIFSIMIFAKGYNVQYTPHHRTCHDNEGR